MNGPAAVSPLRVGLVCDFLEERWPSMDLVAEMLAEQLRTAHADEVGVRTIRPALRRRLSALPGMEERPTFFNLDRFLNRFVDYPRWLAREGGQDVYHVVDHSYAHLVHHLPAERVVVSCYDLDAFRCLLEPELEPRSAAFRAMTRRILSGLQRAARIACSSEATLDRLVELDLVPAERLRLVRLGVHPTCSAAADEVADLEATRLLGEPDGTVDLLHVGSTIRRKRIDVLLQLFAAARAELPRLRLLRVGGAFTREQSEQVERLGLSESIVELPHLSRPVLAAIYRRAALVLQPSEAEGFGLPVVEAMACGTPVLSSDLPVLREVGGEEATYRPVGDVPGWTEATLRLLSERQDDASAWDARRARTLAWAERFSWAAATRQMVELYREVAGRPTGVRFAEGFHS